MITQNVVAIDTGYGAVKIATGPATDAVIRVQSSPSIAILAAEMSASLGSSPNIFEVEARGKIFLVGPGIGSIAHDEKRVLDLSYVESAEYLAITRGALALSSTSHIRTLAVGLPVKSPNQTRNKLREMLVGIHPMPNGKTCTVDNVMVFDQGLGAYCEGMTTATQTLRLSPRELASMSCLMIDVGFLTTDWILVRGQQVIKEYCGSTPSGMSHCLRQVGESIANKLGCSAPTVTRLDESLQNSRHVMVNGERIYAREFLSASRPNMDAVVTCIRRQIPDLSGIDFIVATGGGAATFYDAIVDGFNGRKVQLQPDPQLANVRGFLRLAHARSRYGVNA